MIFMTGLDRDFLSELTGCYGPKPGWAFLTFFEILLQVISYIMPSRLKRKFNEGKNWFRRRQNAITM